MAELQSFSKLKTELLRKFCEAYPHWQGGLKDFGVREIASFQNMLQEKTGGRVSEKWFYTHLKKDHEKLPRVDVLDLLSQFVGHENWGTFQSAAGGTQVADYEGEKSNRLKIMAFAALGALAFFTLISVLSGLTFGAAKQYEVCFVDAMTNKALGVRAVRIEQFKKEESSQVFQADENACHIFEASEEKIVFAVQASYYRADTITRILREQVQKETIALQRDDYAWMIHLFSGGNMEGWKKRRLQLEQMIADDAMIFQVDADSGQAVELFNKQEFIAKLTLPVASLGELEILKSEYDDAGKIRSMRFCQKRK